MGRAAIRQARGGARRVRPRPSFSGAFADGAAAGDGSPKKSGDGMDPTVREFLPWHVVQRKLAARASGLDPNELDDDDYEYEDGPDSGVQESVHLLAANANANANDASDVALSYKVYTIAELDARSGRVAPESSAALPSMRSSMHPVVAGPSPWLKSGEALLAAALVLVRWVTMGKGRPPLADAMRAPGVVLSIELKTLARETNWRKLAFVAGVSLTTITVLLFAVITVAELTDDYHAPGAAAAAHAAELRAVSPATVTTLTSIATAQPAPAAQAAPQMELGDDVASASAPAPAAAPAAAAPHGKRSAKAKTKAPAAPKPDDVEVFVP